MDELRARKLAHHEALFREVNETIVAARGGWSEHTRFICECADTDCALTIALDRRNTNASAHTTTGSSSFRDMSSPRSRTWSSATTTTSWSKSSSLSPTPDRCSVVDAMLGT